MSAYADAQSAYTISSILTAPPERLVLMLYDGAIRFLGQAAAALDGGDLALALEKLKRVDAILNELDGSLDMSHGEIPARLRSIYLFCKQHLLECSVRKDADGVRTIAALLTELREAWDQIASRGTVAAA